MVGVFLLNVVISRLVQTEREQIGLLKAFGHTDLAVGWHYLKFAIAIGLLGAAIGALAAGVARVRTAGHVLGERGAGEAARGAATALRRPEVWRWLGLTKLADLMLDVLFGFLALIMLGLKLNTYMKNI